MKTSNDLEIYELDEYSKDILENICDLRQPVLFDCDEFNCIQTTVNKRKLSEQYPAFEIKIKEMDKENNTTSLCVPLKLAIANNLFMNDPSGNYMSEGNTEFLEETGVIKHMSYNDGLLRPPLVSNCFYDVMFASATFKTPFRYDLNYRNYYVVTQGSIVVKLAPPKSSKYLSPVSDYEMFEFNSPVNPWTPQHKYADDFDKVKCMEVCLAPGRVLFIPAYWWYSFQFEQDTSVACFKYRTYANNVAISPHIFMYALQNQNIKQNIANVYSQTKHGINNEATTGEDKNNKIDS
jgi:hypothetical protein